MPDLTDEYYIYVRRQPTDHRIAKYLLSSFKNPYWDTVSGGVYATMFNQPFIYGFVQCDEAIEGEVAHSGTHGPCPHSIKVCALKSDNSKAIYNILLEKAGPRPNSNRSKPKTGNPCKKDILIILKEKGELRETVLTDILVEIGHGRNNIHHVLRQLRNSGILIHDKDPKNRRYNVFRLSK